MTDPGTAAVTPLRPDERRQLRRVAIAGTLVLVALTITGMLVQRAASTPLVRVGQRAPDATLPATTGGSLATATLRGQPLVLLFVPSVLRDVCQAQLRALDTLAQHLRPLGARVVAVSADTPEIQRETARQLGLGYPLLAEAPTIDRHPLGSAYGVYHRPQRHHRGPVNTMAIVGLDAAGVVRVVEVTPGRSISAAGLRALVRRLVPDAAPVERIP